MLVVAGTAQIIRELVFHPPAAADYFRPTSMRIEVLHWVKIDPDLDPVRDHPYFEAMFAAADARPAHP
jgi:hypothetical protein